MHVEQTVFPNGVQGAMEPMDLHVGVVARVDEPTRRAVCVFLQPPDALITDHKVGAELHDWIDVLQIVTGLLHSAHEAWGPAQPSDLATAQGGV